MYEESDYQWFKRTERYRSKYLRNVFYVEAISTLFEKRYANLHLHHLHYSCGRVHLVMHNHGRKMIFRSKNDAITNNGSLAINFEAMVSRVAVT